MLIVNSFNCPVNFPGLAKHEGLKDDEKVILATEQTILERGQILSREGKAHGMIFDLLSFTLLICYYFTLSMYYYFTLLMYY